MESVNAKRIKLCIQLAELTKRGNVPWKRSDGMVRATVGIRMIFLWEDAGGNAPLEYVLIRHAQTGSDLDQFSDESLETEDFTPEIGMWKVMEETRLLAERQASGLDETLDGLLADLDDLSNPF